MVEAGQDRDDVGARVRVLLGENRRQERAQCLGNPSVSQFVRLGTTPPAPCATGNGPCSHIQGVRVGGRALRSPQHGDSPREELPRVVVGLQQRPGRHAIQYPPQCRPVRSEQEELLPEAFGELCLVIFALGRGWSVFCTAQLCKSSQRSSRAGG